jgi:hypothetical protein
VDALDSLYPGRSFYLEDKKMNEKLITALLAILLALGGWTLQRTFSLSQDMVLIKTKVEIIEDEIQNFKNLKGKKKRKKKKQGD